MLVLLLLEDGKYQLICNKCGHREIKTKDQMSQTPNT